MNNPAYDFYFLTVNQVADELRVSKMSVYRLIKSGALRGAIKVGNTIRVPRESLDEFIREATV